MAPTTPLEPPKFPGHSIKNSARATDNYKLATPSLRPCVAVHARHERAHTISSLLQSRAAVRTLIIIATKCPVHLSKAHEKTPDTNQPRSRPGERTCALIMPRARATDSEAPTAHKCSSYLDNYSHKVASQSEQSSRTTTDV